MLSFLRTDFRFEDQDRPALAVPLRFASREAVHRGGRHRGAQYRDVTAVRRCRSAQFFKHLFVDFLYTLVVFGHGLVRRRRGSRNVARGCDRPFPWVSEPEKRGPDDRMSVACCNTTGQLRSSGFVGATRHWTEGSRQADTCAPACAGVGKVSGFFAGRRADPPKDAVPGTGSTYKTVSPHTL
jgi:hypothetical protein